MAKQETVTQYEWPAGALIPRVTLRAQRDGRAVAYLYANPDPALHARLLDVRAALRLKGFGTLSDHRDGAFVLRVSGISPPEALMATLRDGGYLAGEPASVAVHREAIEQRQGWLSDNILRTSALAYLLGDGLYYKGADNKFDKGMALAFGAGDALLSVFGGKDDARQYTQLLKKLKDHMAASGIDIPATASIHVETSSAGRSMRERFGDVMHQYINPIKILAEVVGGGFVLKSGLDKSTYNRFKIVSGVAIMAGWMGALLVPEKKRDPDAPPETSPLARLGRFIQEKPLRLAGAAGLTFNALKVTDAVVNRRATSSWNLAAVGSMTAANAMYGMAHKSPGGDIKTQAMEGDVYTVAAQIINKQPEPSRERAIASTADFLGLQPEIAGTRAEIIARLRQTIEIQRQNPWFEPVTMPAAQAVSRPHHSAQPATTLVSGQAAHVGKGVEAVNDISFPSIAEANHR